MFLATIVLSVFIIVSSVNSQSTQIQFCADFKPQIIVDVDKLMRTWYGIEIIFHGNTEKEGMKYHQICPIIYLTGAPASSLWAISDTGSSWRTRPGHSNPEWNHDKNWDEFMKPIVKIWKEVTDIEGEENKKKIKSSSDENSLKQIKLRRLRLIWSESGKKVEYLLRYNASRPGYWMNFGYQNGSMLDQNDYEQFIGTVQVLRAVHSHVILTFCHISNKDQFYSLVMARKPHMTERELQDIHNFLHRKHFSVKHIKRMCLEENGALSIRENYLPVFFAVVINLILLRITPICS